MTDILLQRLFSAASRAIIVPVEVCFGGQAARAALRQIEFLLTIGQADEGESLRPTRA